MIQAIVLDFDGVILDSVGAKTRALGALFAPLLDNIEPVLEFHERNPGLDRIRKFEAIFRDFLGREPSPVELDRLSRRFSSLAYDGVLNSPFVPGVESFIRSRAERYPLFIASAAPREEVQAIVRRRGIAAHFRAIHGAPEPKVGILRHIARSGGWKPAEIVFVGDSENDAEAADAVGVMFVLMDSGLGGSDGLASGQMRVVDFRELDERWKQLEGGLAATRGIE